MNQFKINKATVALFVIILILMGSIFYVSFLLSDEKTTNNTSPVAPKKTKAASDTYSKLIALNTISATPTPTFTPTPTQALIAALPSVTTEAGPASVSPTTEVSITSTPTPTEILLALNSPTITEPYASGSAGTITTSATKTASLPESGFINSALVMFISAGLLIFFSFLF